MVQFIYYILFVIGLFSYISERHISFLVCVFGLMTKLFMLDSSETGDLTIQGTDLALILFLILLPLVYIRNRRVFSVDGDSLTKWVYIFIFFYIFELFFTVLEGREALFNSLKVIRVSFVAWSFFIFKTIPLEKYKKFLKIALIITVVQGILYLLQFAGIRLLDGVEDNVDLVIGNASTQAINTPTLLTFFIVFIWKADYLKNKKWILFVFLISLLFISLVRGRIIAVLLGLAYYAFVNSERKRRIPVIIAFLLLIPIASRFIDVKSQQSNSRGLEDIVYVFSNRGDFTSIDRKNGSFSFRMAMLTERFVWLFDHPQYLLTGVGTMHEDSPKTISMFPFEIGTNNEDRANGYTLIESGDITWVPITLRYGFIGIFIHFMMFAVIFNVARKRKDILAVLAPYFIIAFIESFDGAYFERTNIFFLMMLFYSLVSRSNLENEPMIV